MTDVNKYNDLLAECDAAIQDFQEGDGYLSMLSAEHIVSKYPDLSRHMKGTLNGPEKSKVGAPPVKRRRKFAIDKSVQRRRVVLERLKKRYKARKEDEKKDSACDLELALLNIKQRKAAEIDSDDAPPPAPVSGYNLWQGQLKFKLMYQRDMEALEASKEGGKDNNNDSIHVLNNVENKASAADNGRIWRMEVPELDKRYYSIMAQDIRKELGPQYRSFCATGTYRESLKYEHLSFESDGSKRGVWMRRGKGGNALEKWLRQLFDSDHFKSIQEAKKAAKKTISINGTHQSEQGNISTTVSTDVVTKEENETMEMDQNVVAI